MKHKPQLCPGGIEGLIRFVPLMREEGLFLHGFYEGGTINGILCIDRSHKIALDPLKGREHLSERRNNSLARFTGIPFMESRKIPEYR